jgi:DNA polymerase-3 subunit alpha
VVENYRERIFKNGAGRAAFFELEDEVGKVDVKVSEKKIESFAPVLAKGEPVLVEGKISFPMTADDEPDESEGRRATILADTVQSLTEAIKSEARAIAIRLHAERTNSDQLRGLRDVLQRSPGSCAVSVVIELADGAEAVLSLGTSFRVAPTDTMLAGLERLFGDNVAELR